MLDDPFIIHLLKISRNGRYRNSFEITFHVFLRIYLAIQRINIKIDFLCTLFCWIRESIINIKIAKDKLFGYVDRFCRNIKKLAKDEIKKTVSDRVASFIFYYFC